MPDQRSRNARWRAAARSTRTRIAAEEQRLRECHAFDLGGIDALVGRMDQATWLLDAQQHDLGVGKGLVQDVAEWYRAALSLCRGGLAEGLFERVAERGVRAPVGPRDERLSRCTALD